MKALLKYSTIIFLIVPHQLCAQNVITINKTYPTFDAIFKSEAEDKKVFNYYCFKKNGYVYSFFSPLKERKVVAFCKKQEWLKSNAVAAKYKLKQDSISIFPITYSPTGEETINEFYYQGILNRNSNILRLSSTGQQVQKIYIFNWIYPTKNDGDN